MKKTVLAVAFAIGLTFVTHNVAVHLAYDPQPDAPVAPVVLAYDPQPDSVATYV